jgi:hypothetical protein
LANYPDQRPTDPLPTYSVEIISMQSIPLAAGHPLILNTPAIADAAACCIRARLAGREAEKV